MSNRKIVSSSTWLVRPPYTSPRKKNLGRRLLNILIRFDETESFSRAFLNGEKKSSSKGEKFQVHQVQPSVNTILPYRRNFSLSGLVSFLHHLYK